MTTHACANYKAPTTCLTAPSSEAARCDSCRGVIFDEVRQRAEHLAGNYRTEADVLRENCAFLVGVIEQAHALADAWDVRFMSPVGNTEAWAARDLRAILPPKLRGREHNGPPVRPRCDMGHPMQADGKHVFAQDVNEHFGEMSADDIVPMDEREQNGPPVDNWDKPDDDECEWSR